MIATFSDNPRKTLGKLTQALPRAFLEKAAMAFLDAYGSSLGDVPSRKRNVAGSVAAGSTLLAHVAGGV